MCTQKPPYDYSEQLYQRYKDAFNNYINEMVRADIGTTWIMEYPSVVSAIDQSWQLPQLRLPLGPCSADARRMS